MSTGNKAVLMLLLNMFNVCYGMDHAITSTNPCLALLPDGPLEEIVFALSSVCTTFSDVMHSVNSLSRTCSKFHTIVNDQLITQNLIERCSQKPSFAPENLLAVIRGSNLVNSIDGSVARSDRLMNQSQTISLYAGSVLATPEAYRWIQRQISNPEQKRRAECCLRYLLKENLESPTRESRAAFTSLMETGSHLPTNISITHNANQISPFGCAAHSNMHQLALSIFCRTEFIPSDDDCSTMAILFRKKDLTLNQISTEAMLKYIQGNKAKTPTGREAVNAMLTQYQFVCAHRTQLEAFKDNPNTDRFIKFMIREALDGFREPKFCAGDTSES
jgi:hypothetical protein